MDDTVRTKLKDILARHGRELLDDPRRCENVLKENCPQAKREVVPLVTALREGIPQRLLSMPAASLTTTTVRNSATQIAEDTGLQEEVARWAIETWGGGLGLTIAGIEPQPRSESTDRKSAEKDASAAAVTGIPSSKEIRLVGFLILVCGIAAILISAFAFIRFHSWN